MALKMSLRVWTSLMLVMCGVNLSQQSEQPTNNDILMNIVGKLDQIDTRLGKLDQIDTKLSLFATKLDSTDSRLGNIESGLEHIYNSKVDINKDLPAMTGRSSQTLSSVQKLVEEIEVVNDKLSDLNVISGELNNLRVYMHEDLDFIKNMNNEITNGLIEINEKLDIIYSMQNETKEELLDDISFYKNTTNNSFYELIELNEELSEDLDIIKNTNNDTTNGFIEMNEKLDIIYSTQNKTKEELLDDLNFLKNTNNDTSDELDEIKQKIDILNVLQNMAYDENNQFREKMSVEMNVLLITQNNITEKQGFVLNSLNQTGYEVDNINQKMSKSVKILKEIQICTTGQQECNGRLIIPKKGSAKMNWDDAVSHCHDMNAQPFVPKTRQDFEIIKKVRIELDGYLWLPASDVSEEGTLKWWNGEDARGSPGLIWSSDVEMIGNYESRDCVLYGQHTHGVEMYPCSQAHPYPMICTQ